MLAALLYGKLSREQENMEDILTSSVFGLLSYLPPERGLLPFLAMAEDRGGNAPLAGLASASVPTGQQVRYEFWPAVQEGDCLFCEPDVLITVPLASSRTLLVLVEAKYLSGKSSGAASTCDRPTDQLAREWDNLIHVASRRQADPVLIYLTADTAHPRADVKASLREYGHKRPDASAPKMLWLTWRKIKAAFGTSSDAILQDLVRLIERLNLVAFEGFAPIGPIPKLGWHFVPSGFAWTVLSQPASFSWAFEPSGFDWIPATVRPFTWRFTA